MEFSCHSLFRNLKPLILASSSPRRRDMLRAVGLAFQVVASGIEETGDLRGNPEALVERWATEKAVAVAADYPDHWVLAADTIVVLEGKVFGKPGNADEAASMLRELSGLNHEVVSGLCLVHHVEGVLRVGSIKTQVRFKELTDLEIQAYVNTGEPLDKAGAYGIQGMGAFLVRSVSGSYTSVVGLPLCEALEWMLQEGVIAPVVGECGG